MADTSIPTATVTFLFTDIEGSTKRWERSPEAMAAALARHDAVLRAAVESHGGRVFKTVGDAFCAAFATAATAVEAALAAQHGLASEPWSGVGSVRVRMALHTGRAQERDRDYFGPEVNRVARLLSTGHGGQILLSGTTAALVRDHLAASVDLLDLGLHRLKDLLQPERVYQVRAPGLHGDFPPLNSLDRQPHNLPTQPTPLIGREALVARVCRLLATDQKLLVTLTGPGGTGKTRVAIQAAAELLDAFADGAWFVDLAALGEPDLVLPAVARALGVRETGLEPLADSVRDYLRHKRLLLVVDNFEHVLAAAPTVGTLLAECRGLRVLATSRAPLGVYGEREFIVPPLDTPDPTQLLPLDQLAGVPAVALFVERARAAKASFVLDGGNAAAVAEICDRLDGLPLAVELAAARAKILSPQATLVRLTRRLDFLSTGPKDRPHRLRTMRNAVAWSHDLLDAPDQTLFARVSVFAGGFTLGAAEAVCNGAGDLDVLEGVASLADKSMLRQHDAPGHEPRFAMLAVIREFAREQLAAHGEEPAVLDAHAAYFGALIEEAAPELVGSRPTAWLDRLEEEHANLGAALDWLTERGAVGPAVDFSEALWLYWEQRGYLHEGWSRTERVAERSVGTEPTIRARALNQLGAVATELDDYRRARPLYEESLSLCRASGHRMGTASVLNNLGRVAYMQGDYANARACLVESRAILKDLGHERGVAFVLDNLGDIAAALGDGAEARRLHEEALALLEAAKDRSSLGVSFSRIGRTMCDAGEAPEARRWFEQGLALSEEVGDRPGTAAALHGLGVVALRQQDGPEGTRLLREALKIRRNLGDAIGCVECIEEVACFAVDHGQAEAGVRMLAATSAIRAARAAPRRPVDQPTRDRSIAMARASLGEATFRAAWATGSGWTLDEATAAALR